MMCGLAGIEFLSVVNGDVLEFVPSQPAFSASFTPTSGVRASGPELPTLDATFNTSWVRFQPSGHNALPSYYAQPNASVSYGRGTLPQKTNYPAAVSSFVSSLAPSVENGPPPVFPLVPYGDVFALADGTPQDGTALTAFEKQVLVTVRGGRIRGAAPSEPVFTSESGTPLSGTRAATPQGLLVQLNDTPKPAIGRSGVAGPPAGTWKSLILARSGEQHLSFEADSTGVVDAKLASALMREQLFLVLNDWSHFPNIQRRLTVEGFNFEVAPDPNDPDARSTVLVFKYSTTLSLAQLIDATEYWAEKDYFVGGASSVAAAQETLKKALKAADVPNPDVPFVDFPNVPNPDDDPFVDFRRLATDPTWTGLIAFNAPINGNGMPTDLQMLFAGIDGPLKAHHFGVQINRLHDSTDTTPVPEITESSLFGVIYYQKPPTRLSAPRAVEAIEATDPPDDYAFIVEELAIAIKNSSITQFHCQVGMTINKLFGRDVILDGQGSNDPPSNRVIVSGQYQKHGGVGTVTFHASRKGQFLFNPDGSRIRVLKSFRVSGASLVPVASHQKSTNPDVKSTVSSRFTLAGTLAFAADPFPGVEGLDLYSYGTDATPGPDATPPEGLNLSGLSFAISFDLNASGQRVGKPKIEPDLSAVLASDNPKAQRTEALVRMLPLKLNAILHNPNGLDPKALGGMAVNIPDLMSVVVKIPTAKEDETVTSQVAYVTSKPHYALQFSLSLGTLGALADVHASLDAALIVAWGPSTYTPENDGAALFIQLPQVSAGAFGFNLQGLLKTTFGDANLGLVMAKSGPAYVLLFNNVALSVLGITLPPKVITDFILFAAAKNPAGSNLGWSLASTQAS